MNPEAEHWNGVIDIWNDVGLGKVPQADGLVFVYGGEGKVCLLVMGGGEQPAALVTMSLSRFREFVSMAQKMLTEHDAEVNRA